MKKQEDSDGTEQNGNLQPRDGWGTGQWSSWIVAAERFQSSDGVDDALARQRLDRMRASGPRTGTAALWFSGIATFAAAVALFFNYADQHNRQVDQFEGARRDCTNAATDSYQDSERLLLASSTAATALPEDLWDAYLDFGTSYYPIHADCFQSGIVADPDGKIGLAWAQNLDAAREELTPYMAVFGHSATSSQESLAQRLTIPVDGWESVTAYRESVNDILVRVEKLAAPSWLPWDWAY